MNKKVRAVLTTDEEKALIERLKVGNLTHQERQDIEDKLGISRNPSPSVGKYTNAFSAHVVEPDEQASFNMHQYDIPVKLDVAEEKKLQKAEPEMPAKGKARCTFCYSRNLAYPDPHAPEDYVCKNCGKRVFLSENQKIEKELPRYKGKCQECGIRSDDLVKIPWYSPIKGRPVNRLVCNDDDACLDRMEAQKKAKQIEEEKNNPHHHFYEE